MRFKANNHTGGAARGAASSLLPVCHAPASPSSLRSRPRAGAHLGSVLEHAYAAPGAKELDAVRVQLAAQGAHGRFAPPRLLDGQRVKGAPVDAGLRDIVEARGAAKGDERAPAARHGRRYARHVAGEACSDVR